MQLFNMEPLQLMINWEVGMERGTFNMPQVSSVVIDLSFDLMLSLRDILVSLLIVPVTSAVFLQMLHRSPKTCPWPILLPW